MRILPPLQYIPFCDSSPKGEGVYFRSCNIYPFANNHLKIGYSRPCSVYPLPALLQIGESSPTITYTLICEIEKKGISPGLRNIPSCKKSLEGVYFRYCNIYPYANNHLKIGYSRPCNMYPFAKVSLKAEIPHLIYGPSSLLCPALSFRLAPPISPSPKIRLLAKGTSGCPPLIMRQHF